MHYGYSCTKPAVFKEMRGKLGENCTAFPSYSSMARRSRKDLHCSPLANSPSLAYSMRGGKRGDSNKRTQKTDGRERGRTMVHIRTQRGETIRLPLLFFFPPLSLPLHACTCVSICLVAEAKEVLERILAYDGQTEQQGTCIPLQYLKVFSNDLLRLKSTSSWLL